MLPEGAGYKAPGAKKRKRAMAELGAAAAAGVDLQQDSQPKRSGKRKQEAAHCDVCGIDLANFSQLIEHREVGWLAIHASRKTQLPLRRPLTRCLRQGKRHRETVQAKAAAAYTPGGRVLLGLSLTLAKDRRDNRTRPCHSAPPPALHSSRLLTCTPLPPPPPPTGL
jgi:hypothetical protein